MQNSIIGLQTNLHSLGDCLYHDGGVRPSTSRDLGIKKFVDLVKVPNEEKHMQVRIEKNCAATIVPAGCSKGQYIVGSRGS